MDDIESIWNVLEGLTSRDVYEAYMQTSNQFKVVWTGTGLGCVVSLFLLFKHSGETALSAIGWKNGEFVNKPQWSKLIALLQPTAYILLVVVAYPHVLNGIENLLSYLQDSLGGEINPQSDYREIWLEEATQYQRLMSETSTWDIGKKLSIITNYYIILLFKPFIILLEQDAYSLYLMLRYLYLMILQLFGGVALALYLDKETRNYTFTWLKHMIFNYSMIGVFGIVNFFADAVIDIFITNNSVYSYNILLIAFGLVIKLFLFKKSFTILTSNIF